MPRFRIWLHGWLLSLLLAAAAFAQPALTDTDAQAVRATVEAQLAAMAADDAERAFSFAASGIREQFGDAASFMTMVRRGYPMVIKPAATTFFVPLAGTGGASQQVRLLDAEGRQWLATYALLKQADGNWRIAGCSVVADTGGRSV